MQAQVNLRIPRLDTHPCGFVHEQAYEHEVPLTCFAVTTQPPQDESAGELTTDAHNAAIGRSPRSCRRTKPQVS